MKEVTLMLLKLSHGNSRGRDTGRLILIISVTLIPKLGKHTTPTTELQTNVPDVHRPKMLLRALANQIQEHIEKVICCDQIGWPSAQ